MSIVDVILVICFIPAIIRGLTKGFIHQAFSLMAAVVGIWFSYHFAQVVSGWLGEVFHASPVLLYVIAFLAILFAVVVALSFVGTLLEKLMRIVMLGWLDKLLGLVFSLVTAALVIGIFIVLFEALDMRYHIVNHAYLDASKFYAPLRDLALKAFPFFKGLLTP